MPGKHLSGNEVSLLNYWRRLSANTTPTPFLQSIEVDGGTGLRGINGLIVPFRYPITAICGNNGVGKTTILALAALGFHSPAGWFVHRGNTVPARRTGDKASYTFSDYFLRGPGEIIPQGVSITWRYYQAGRQLSLTFRKTLKQWGRYRNRPERHVDFLPLARILSGCEISGVRSTFKALPPGVERTALSRAYRDYLSFIMGKPYTQAEIQKSLKYSFARCEADSEYTAFNMGGGESCMVALIYSLQRMPDGGLIVIEEIEAGLHPQAQQRLAEVLVSVCRKKRLQIICSTHSNIFLDALPKQARLLIKKSGMNHFAVEGPSTRYAMYEMTGQFQPELMIYCEDEVAKCLVEKALPERLRLRVEVRPIGNNNAVIRQGISHDRSGFSMDYICVLDGDCTEGKIREWIESERGERADIDPPYIVLPGDGLPPEKWITEQLKLEPYRNEFARQFGCSIADAQAHIQALEVELNHHDIGYALHQRTNIDTSDCIKYTTASVAPLHPQLDELRQRIEKMLDPT